MTNHFTRETFKNVDGIGNDKAFKYLYRLIRSIQWECYIENILLHTGTCSSYFIWMLEIICFSSWLGFFLTTKTTSVGGVNSNAFEFTKKKWIFSLAKEQWLPTFNSWIRPGLLSNQRPYTYGASALPAEIP